MSFDGDVTSKERAENGRMASTQLNRHAFDRPGGPVPVARRRSRAPWKRRRSSEIDKEGAALDSPTGVVPDTFRSDHRYEFPTPDSYLSVLSAADEPTTGPPVGDLRRFGRRTSSVGPGSTPGHLSDRSEVLRPSILLHALQIDRLCASRGASRDVPHRVHHTLESRRPAARWPLWRRVSSRITGPPGAAPPISRRGFPDGPTQTRTKGGS